MKPIHLRKRSLSFLVKVTPSIIVKSTVKSPEKMHLHAISGLQYYMPSSSGAMKAERFGVKSPSQTWALPWTPAHTRRISRMFAGENYNVCSYSVWNCEVLRVYTLSYYILKSLENSNLDEGKAALWWRQRYGSNFGNNEGFANNEGFDKEHRPINDWDPHFLRPRKVVMLVLIRRSV